MGSEQVTKEDKAQETEKDSHDSFLPDFESIEDSQEKLAFGIQSMKTALSQEGVPCFKEFWEIRKQCLELFKEPINPIQRRHLWGQYIELSNEARRLKEILDEQTNFAVEQIDLAISSIEADVSKSAELLDQTPSLDFPDYKQALKGSTMDYESLQKELGLLNSFALKVNALRKELIKTEMRISQKNKFFKRLAELGDFVFPTRKQKIQELSDGFLRDVQIFVGRHFQEGDIPKAPYYILREEIKSLQSMAKILTLHTSAFTKVRELLSKCWDRLKELDRVRKQQKVQKSEKAEKAFTAIEGKLTQLKELSDSPESSLDELKKISEEIFQEISSHELDDEEEKPLRRSVSDVMAVYHAREKEIAKQKKQEEKKEHQQKAATLKQELQDSLSLEVEPEKIRKMHASFVEKVDALNIKALDKEIIEKMLASLHDRYLRASMKDCIKTQKGDELKASLEKLLEQKKQRRQEIKNQIEVYRRAVGSSNCNIEQGMAYREMLDDQKSSLEQVDESIDQIEEHLLDLD